MTVYRIYRLNDSQRNQFRWAAHTSGVTDVKPRDYVEEGTVEAATPYSVWHQLKQSDHPLELGDLLESPSGELCIYKYVGFEEARWLLPQVTTGLEAAPPAMGAPSTAASS